MASCRGSGRACGWGSCVSGEGKGVGPQDWGRNPGPTVNYRVTVVSCCYLQALVSSSRKETTKQASQLSEEAEEHQQAVPWPHTLPTTLRYFPRVRLLS